MTKLNRDKKPPVWHPADSREADRRLQQARAATVCGRDAEALDLLHELRLSTDRTIVARAAMQIARVLHRQGETKAATETLESVLDSQRDRPGGMSAALTLEIARTAARIDCRDRAKILYRELIESREHDKDTPKSGAGVHAVALAHYRLGHLFMAEGEITEAYNHWRSAFEENSDDVLPYAAYALASQIGSKRLPPGQIERMYMHAVRCDQLELSLLAQFQLALFLTRRCQYKSAQKHLLELVELGVASYAEQARNQLAYLEAEIKSTHELKQLQNINGLRARWNDWRTKTDQRRLVIIVGAGTGGRYLLEDLDRLPNGPVIAGFVDDDPQKIPPGRYPMLGSIDRLREIIRHEGVHEVLMAIPTAPGTRRLAVVNACRDEQVPLLNLPRMHELSMGWDKNKPTLANQLRAVRIEETIGDAPQGIDEAAIAWAKGKRALVIGAEGIGAELCRRLASGTVESVAVMDPSESALQRLTMELAEKYDFHWVVPIHSDWLDVSLLTREILNRKPAVVFNAGGLAGAVVLERSSHRGACREILGARAVAQAAAAAGVPHLLHVSNPRAGDWTDMLGVVKALSEETVLSVAHRSPDTNCAIVQTVAPMESSGSVLSRIASQIDAGRPITVSDEKTTARFVSMARTAELMMHVARLMIEQGLNGRLALNAGVVKRVDEAARQMASVGAQNSYSDISVGVSPSSPSGHESPTGEPIFNEEILRLQHRERLDDDALDTLVDYLTELASDAEWSTAPIRMREFEFIAREHLSARPVDFPRETRS